MFPHKISPVVLFWTKSGKIHMACFTGIRRLAAVVTRHALRHFRDALFCCQSHLVEALVAGLAGELLIGEVKLVIENQVPLGILEGDIRGNIIGRVAVCAVVGELFFVTALTIRLLRQQVVGHKRASSGCIMTILAGDADLLDMKRV